MVAKNASGHRRQMKMTLAKRLHGDGKVQGKEQTHIDQRTCYDPIETWSDQDVEQIMIENEMLRETLYANQNTHYNRNIDLMIQRQGQSSSQIIKLTKSIEDHTKGAIKAQDAFRIVYATMSNQYRIKFENRKPKESKLQYCWRTGSLPLVSELMCALKDTILSLHRIDPHGTSAYLSGIAKKIKPKQKKQP